MIKTTKKVIAIVMAAMLMLAMVPFTASAATEKVSFTVDCAKPGYTFAIYQVATLDTQTGEYSVNANVDSAVKDAVLNASSKTSDILAACDAATNVGAIASNYISTGSSSPKTITVDSGIYYIKAINMPATVKSVTNSIVTLPYYENNAWVDTLTETIDLATKVNDGDVVVSKEIVNGDSTRYTTAGVGKDVQFELASSVVGSKDMKLKEYTVTDIMGSGLTYKSIDSVKLTGSTTGQADKTLTTSEYTKNDNYTFNGTVYTFGITLADSVISADDFYDYANVEVLYTATLNSDAVIGSAGNPNSDALVYTNANDVSTRVDGNEVKVYTFAIDVEKVNANDNSVKLAGAEFSVYDDQGDLIAKAVTDNNGSATFMEIDAQSNITSTVYRFDKGEYIVKETKAPVGYNINASEFVVNITPTFNNGTLSNPASGHVSVTVENTPALLPETGGMGTAIFSLTGAALIACAGILFVIIKRKKASK